MLLTILCCFHASLNDCCQCDRFPSCFWTHWGQSHNYGFKKISALPYLLSMLISTYAFVPLMYFPISILYLNTSVTWWLDYLFNIWPFTTMRMCPKYIKITKVCSKVWHIQKEPFQNGQSCLASCLSGEISPNLVTLDSWHKDDDEEEEDPRAVFRKASFVRLTSVEDGIPFQANHRGIQSSSSNVLTLLPSNMISSFFLLYPVLKTNRS